MTRRSEMRAEAYQLAPMVWIADGQKSIVTFQVSGGFERRVQALESAVRCSRRTETTSFYGYIANAFRVAIIRRAIAQWKFDWTLSGCEVKKMNCLQRLSCPGADMSTGSMPDLKQGDLIAALSSREPSPRITLNPAIHSLFGRNTLLKATSHAWTLGDHSDIDDPSRRGADVIDVSHWLKKNNFWSQLGQQ